MITDLLQLLLDASVLGTAAMLLVALLRKPLRERLGARAAYALWSMLPLVLIASLLPDPSVGLAMTSITHPFVGVVSLGNMMAPEPISEATIWLAGWMIGVLSMAALLIARQMKLHEQLHDLVLTPDGSWRSPHVLTPALVGLWRPRIVLPADFEQRYCEDEQALVLAHERAHLRQGDPWANAVACAFLCMFWFNPLVYWAFGRFRFDQELACDACVVSQTPNARQRYAQALLKTQLSDDAPWHLPLSCHWQSCHPLKERIAMLKRPLPTGLRRRIGLAFALVLCATASVVVWAAQPTTQSTPLPDSSTDIPVKEDITARTPPGYPKAALDANQGGKVLLRVQIDSSGNVVDVLVDHSEPAGVFEQVSINAAKQWKFNPGRKDGKPVGGWVLVPISFEPDSPHAAEPSKG